MLQENYCPTPNNELWLFFGYPGRDNPVRLDKDEVYVYTTKSPSEEVASKLPKEQLYFIPTRNETGRPLFLKELKGIVDTFIEFAVNHPGISFIVPTIGYGLAGYTEKEIAPLFAGCIGKGNIHLPIPYILYLSKNYK